MRAWWTVTSALLCGSIVACSSDVSVEVSPLTLDGGADGSPYAGCPTGQAACNGACIDVLGDDANCGACANACTGGTHCAAGTCKASNIEHVVLIVEENHTFDAYFGRYCQAPSGSNPTCTQGPNCCERAPDQEPHGASPGMLDDASNFATDRDHAQACELQQINGGKMDGYVTGSMGAQTCLGVGPKCSSPNNFVLAEKGTMSTYWSYADQYALADRYFQPIAGGTASNNMYFATAHYQFTDNDMLPITVGSPVGCGLGGYCLDGKPVTYKNRKTIADVLLLAKRSFTIYLDGYAHALSQAPKCETVPPDCTYSQVTHPVAAQACKLDASDVPFNYYANFADGSHTKDFAQLVQDLGNNALPTFSYVKAREFHNEHPNVSTITDGEVFVAGVVNSVLASPYKNNTLVLLTWDEGGGFFDHVAPPQSIDTDDIGNPVPYGTRVAMLAIGKFAKKGTISHVPMEHSSIVRFLEWNFVGPTGQLAGNDVKVNNIGSMLDPAQTGITIP
jgi:phospholipase C